MTGADSVVHIAVPPVIDLPSGHELADAIWRAVADTETRVIVLEGSTGVFCKGLDVSTVRSSIAETRTAMTDLAECLLTLRRAPAAVIAVVDGAVLGGGVGLVAASDLVIATENSSFGLPEVLFGLAPSIVLPFLLERMRLQEVRLWALSAYARSATQAANAGLVDVLVPVADIQRQTAHWVRQLSRTQRDGSGRVKRLTAEIAGMNLETAVRSGVAYTAQALSDPKIPQLFRDIITG